MYSAISIRFPIASENHKSLPFPIKPCIYSIYRIVSVCASAQGIYIAVTQSTGRFLKWRTSRYRCNTVTSYNSTRTGLRATHITILLGLITCHITLFRIFVIGKGEAIPVQVWTGPEGSRGLSFPDFMTVGT